MYEKNLLTAREAAELRFQQKGLTNSRKPSKILGDQDAEKLLLSSSQGLVPDSRNKSEGTSSGGFGSRVFDMIYASNKELDAKVLERLRPLPKPDTEVLPAEDYPESTSEVGDALVLSPKDVDLLERVVWAEAGTEDVNGRNAVRGVILNRIASDRFPNTLQEVLTESGQFEPVGNVSGDISKIKAPATRLDQQYFELLQYLSDGKDASQGSTFFVNKTTAKKRGTDFSGPNPLEVGRHTFYSGLAGQEPVVVPDYSHNVVIKR